MKIYTTLPDLVLIYFNIPGLQTKIIVKFFNYSLIIPDLFITRIPPSGCQKIGWNRQSIGGRWSFMADLDGTDCLIRVSGGQFSVDFPTAEPHVGIVTEQIPDTRSWLKNLKNAANNFHTLGK